MCLPTWQALVFFQKQPALCAKTYRRTGPFDVETAILNDRRPEAQPLLENSFFLG
jgi:hypothetical protein